jgi:mono/diheme cytochrome c family protein
VNDQEKSKDQPPARAAEDSGPLPPLLGEPEREDLHTIHQGILERERLEPREGLEPPPWWLWTISVLVIFAMGFYIGRYGGTFSAEPHELYQKVGPARGEVAAPPPRGDLIYSAVCLPCHQSAGAGLEGKYGSEWVAMDAGVLARIVLHGVQGPIRVKGKTYVNEMLPLGEQLSDSEIAAVLSYVRSSWGNSSDPVTPELVGQVRETSPGQTPWTAESLMALAGAKQ